MTLGKPEIILLGCGGHAESVIDSIESSGIYQIVGLVDQDNSTFQYRSYPVIGCDDDLVKIFHSGIRCAFICVGFMGRSHLRQRLYQRLRDIGYTLPIIQDPSSVVAPDAVIGEGTFIGKKTVVNSKAVIGKNVILNTGALVEHGCQVGDYTHIAVSSTLCGNVSVGENCFVGAGSVILQGVNIAEEGMIGAGSIIRKDTPPKSLVYTEKVVHTVPI